MFPSPRPFGSEQRERRRGAPVSDPKRWHIGRAEAEVVHEGAREQVAVLVVMHALQQRCAGAVYEAAADLPLDEQRVQQPPRIVNGHVVEDLDHPRLAIDLDDGDVDDEAVSGRRGDAVLGVRRREVRRRVERGLMEAGFEPRRKGVRVPVRGAGEPSQRDARIAKPRLPVAERDLVCLAVQCLRRDRPQLRGDLRRGEMHGGRAHAREPRRVVARGNAPGARRCVDVGQDVDVLGPDAERVGNHLGGDGAVALPLRRRPDPNGDPSER